MADPKAVVSRYIACTEDFIDGGAFVYAYSNPATEAKISETLMSMYAPVCAAMWVFRCRYQYRYKNLVLINGVYIDG